MDPPIRRLASVLVASPPEPGRFLHAKELPRRFEVSHPTPLPLHTHHDSRLFAPVLGRECGGYAVSPLYRELQIKRRQPLRQALDAVDLKHVASPENAFEIAVPAGIKADAERINAGMGKR